MISFQTELTVLDSNVWGRCLFVPKEHIQTLRSWSSKRYICTLNKSERIHCGLMPHGDGKYFILVNKTLANKLKVAAGDQVDVQLEEDNSKYGMAVPEEFMQALELDQEASDCFHDLTPGKQRNLIYLVGLPKTSEKRITRSLTVLEYLKTSKGVLDFKALHAAIKKSNTPY